MIEVVFPRNQEQAVQMAAYMKNHFDFAGVQATERKQLCKALLKESKKMSYEDLFDLIIFYYEKKEREYHYLGIDLAIQNVKKMTLEEVLRFKPFVIKNVWWDSVDTWRKFFGLWCETHFEEMPVVFDAFYGEENFWYRRVALNLQLMFKNKTNTELLEKAILYDKNTEEFFIQKAIGWSLRQYSKTNPEWVQQFIEANKLSQLAVREGSKYLPKK